MDTLIAWILAFTIGAGVIFVWAIIETELENRREARRRQFHLPKPPKDNVEILDVAAKPVANIVRGYDSRDLFRVDSLVRLRELEREIAADMKEVERYRTKSERK